MLRSDNVSSMKSAEVGMLVLERSNANDACKMGLIALKVTRRELGSMHEVVCRKHTASTK